MDIECHQLAGYTMDGMTEFGEYEDGLDCQEENNINANATPEQPASTDWFGLSAPKFGTLIRNRIFVGGISSQTTEQELTQLFSAYGNVKASKIIFDRAGISKGYGFVTFQTEAESEALCNSIMKKELEPIMLRERKLNVAPAVKKQPGFRTDFPFLVDQHSSMPMYGMNGSCFQRVSGFHDHGIGYNQNPLQAPQDPFYGQSQHSTPGIVPPQQGISIGTPTSQPSMPVCFIQPAVSTGFPQVSCFVPQVFPTYSFPTSSSWCGNSGQTTTYFDLAAQQAQQYNTSQYAFDSNSWANLNDASSASAYNTM